MSNTGSSTATGSSLTWTVPADLAAVSATGPAGACGVTASTVQCDLGSLAAGAAVNLTLTATAPTRSGAVDLSVDATHAVDEANPSDNSASVSVALRPALSSDTVVADGFERADTSGGVGTSDSGHVWTTHAGAPQVAGLALTPGGGYGLTTVDSSRSDAVVSTTLSTTGAEHWLVVPTLVGGGLLALRPERRRCLPAPADQGQRPGLACAGGALEPCGRRRGPSPVSPHDHHDRL